MSQLFDARNISPLQQLAGGIPEAAGATGLRRRCFRAIHSLPEAAAFHHLMRLWIILLLILFYLSISFEWYIIYAYHGYIYLSHRVCRLRYFQLFVAHDHAQTHTHFHSFDLLFTCYLVVFEPTSMELVRIQVWAIYQHSRRQTGIWRNAFELIPHIKLHTKQYGVIYHSDILSVDFCSLYWNVPNAIGKHQSIDYKYLFKLLASTNFFPI